MKPEEHKAEIVRALNRCRQAAWLDEGLNKQLESALDALVNDYQACLLHNELLAARLRLRDFHYKQPDLRSQFFRSSETHAKGECNDIR